MSLITNETINFSRLTSYPQSLSGLTVYTRSDETELEPHEKVVILPLAENDDAATHSWADARFAVDIMTEHALFFALLMPPEVAPEERDEALHFYQVFNELYMEIDANPPQHNELKRFAQNVIEKIKPFIEYKARLGDDQRSGKLRSLVWPLFFDHTRHEAERWIRRLGELARGESEFDRAEVIKFWTNIMDEHARFVAHLLDPSEYELIETATKTSRVFADLNKGGAGGIASALIHEPVTVTNSLIKNPEMDAVLSAAETILDFKTQAARNIEIGRIKSIIDPRLADHVRREAVKFIDELKRAV